MTRYLLQYVVPLLLLALVVYLFRNLRSSEKASETEQDRSVVLLLFFVGTAIAALLGLLFYQYLES